MTKLRNFNLQNAEILDKKGMKEVTGGIGEHCVCSNYYDPVTGGSNVCTPPGCNNAMPTDDQSRIACNFRAVGDPCSVTTSNGSAGTIIWSGHCKIKPSFDPTIRCYYIE